MESGLREVCSAEGNGDSPDLWSTKIGLLPSMGASFFACETYALSRWKGLPVAKSKAFKRGTSATAEPETASCLLSPAILSRNKPLNPMATGTKGTKVSTKKGAEKKITA